MSGKLLGRQGWFGQCSCCSDKASKRVMRKREARQWRKDMERSRD